VAAFFLFYRLKIGFSGLYVFLFLSSAAPYQFIRSGLFPTNASEYTSDPAFDRKLGRKTVAERINAPLLCSTASTPSAFLCIFLLSFINIPFAGCPKAFTVTGGIGSAGNRGIPPGL
jgi:hypothetical protein